MLESHLANDILVLAAMEDTQLGALVVGVGTIAGGILLMIRHKRALEEVERHERDARTRAIELKKFRRRTMASTLIAAMGVLIASLHWAREPVVFSILIGLILIAIVAILFLAFLDLMTVSLHSLADTRDDARERMIQEYLKQRKRQQEDADRTDQTSSDDPSSP